MQGASTQVIQKPLDTIEKRDIEALVADRVRESKSIEYKQELPGNADKQKREFLADVSSFSNAGGGDILFGIKGARDSDGKATGDGSSAIAGRWYNASASYPTSVAWPRAHVLRPTNRFI